MDGDDGSWVSIMNVMMDYDDGEWWMMRRNDGCWMLIMHDDHDGSMTMTVADCDEWVLDEDDGWWIMMDDDGWWTMLVNGRGDDGGDGDVDCDDGDDGWLCDGEWMIMIKGW